MATPVLTKKAYTVADVKGKRVPLLIKVAPDLTAEEKADVAAVALRTKIDGLIVSNTTIARPDSLQVGWLVLVRSFVMKG